MQIDILHRPDSAIARCQLEPYEEVLAEAGAMVAMDGQVSTTTTLRQGKGGGIFGGLKRLAAGESLFVSSFRAGARPGDVFLAPRLVGDIIQYDLGGPDLVIQSTGYLACAPSVSVDVGFQGMRSLFSGESIFWLHASGQGPILLSAFGGIYTVEVDGDYVVDTGHIVAFEQTLNFSIAAAGNNILGSFLGGEGLICHFRGRGKVFCQTHNPGAFGQRVGSRLPPR
ncbi:TIGR00266 family protein [filamentous cyanobacterium CCP5]|nr:TIGR00266 family protein [filamentous cyanobacterium CCP5]